MPPFVVSAAAPHELLPACRLLFPDGRAEYSRDRLLADANASGLFVSRSTDGKLHAAALVQTLPGALGVTWAPRGDSHEAINAATSAACEWLRARGVKVCQAFASAEEVPDMLALERHGFQHTTQLVFLRRELDNERLPEKPEPFAYQAETPPFSNEFQRVLLATHEGSLDCPELNACRTPAEILAGFAEPTQGGEWGLVRHGNEPIGVLVHTRDANFNTADVTYVGILPAFRRRGLGSRLMCHNMWCFFHAALRAVNVSVDARNIPAMKLYARHGFVEHDRREVWLASWPT